MENLLQYIIESSAILAVMYIIYIAFLKSDTAFTAHRWYLLTSLIMASMLPLIQIHSPIAGSEKLMASILDPIVINASDQGPGLAVGLRFFDVLTFIYFAGLISFALLFLSRFSSLLLLISKTKNPNQPIVSGKESVPFSFFSYTFIPDNKFTPKEVETIRIHEEAHVRQWHSIDILIVELMLPLFWFNPLFWLLRKDLKSTHEYLADRHVIEQGQNLMQYQKLLFLESTGMRLSTVSNNFNHSLIKKRIIMMTKPKAAKLQMYKYVFIAPISVVIALLLAFSIQQNVMGQAGGEIPPPPPKSSDNAKAVGSAPASAIPAGQKEEVIYNEVEVMPKYKGGNEALGKFFVENVKYPENAKKEGISGAVYISFLIDKKGHIKDAKVKRGVESTLDAEALRVVNIMPAWSPGMNDGKPVNTMMTLPVKFNLDSEKKK